MDGLTAVTLGLVVATGLLSVGTFRLAHFARASLLSYRAVERACVELSHLNGLAFDPTRVGMQAQNAGKTPATVTEMFVEAVVGALPAKPKYSEPKREPNTAFLVAGSKVFFDELLGVPLDQLQPIKAGRLKLHVIGYVDYIDTFGERRRNGYARRYEPSLEGNNLVFATERGYHYDRARIPGEGNDWTDLTVK
jgi:hypothetical protein